MFCLYYYMCECEVAQSCPTLCNPVDYSPPSSSVHGILQAGKLKWIAIPFSRESSRPRDRSQVSRISGRCFNLWATREALKGYVPGWAQTTNLLVNSRTALTDCATERILEWVAVSFSRGSFRSRDRTQVSHTAGRLFTIWITRDALDIETPAKNLNLST